METYHKIQTLFKRDMDGSITGQKGKMIRGQWTTPELAYLANNKWEFTEKVDGTNIRIGFGPYATIDPSAWKGETKGVDFAGRTDNAVIPKQLKQYLEETFTPDLFVRNELNGITLFGEGYGPKIQGGGKYRDDHSFVLFDVKIGDFWLSRDNVNGIAKKLGIDAVPVIGYGTLYDAIELVSTGLESLWTKVSAYHEPFEAEGIVARPFVPMFDRKGERIITKIKAVDFR